MQNLLKDVTPASNKWILLFAITAAVILVFSISYPPLNWPDELYKISTLYKSDNLYLQLIDWLQKGGCGINYTSSSLGSYGSNQLTIRILSGFDCYRELKIINSMLIVAVICMCLLSLRSDMRRIFLMSIIWPSSIFFLTSVNNQVIFHIVSIALGVYSLYARNLIFPILLSIALIAVDRSFITALIFFSFLQGLRLQKIFTIIFFVSIFLFSQFATGILETFYSGVAGIDAKSLTEVQSANETYRDSIIFSLLIFFISFVYLGGTSAVFGIGIDYLFVYVYIIKSYLQIKERKNVNLYIISIIMSYYLVLQFVPTIQSFRYYVFLIPIFISFFVKLEHQKHYISYCLLMNAIYVIIGYLVQGGSQ